MIERIAAPTMASRAVSVMMPSCKARVATMNENSPTCPSAAATARPTRTGCRNILTVANAASGLPTMTTARVAAIRSGRASMRAGFINIPTETKNSTANASRIGSASAAARRLKSDRPTMRPARNAPRAIDTPKSFADATAIPRAVASTASVNSSRDRVRATRVSTQGIARPPAQMATAIRTPTFSSAMTNAAAGDWPFPGPNTAGISTRTSTVNTSSTTSQPTARCPVGVCSWPLSLSILTRTTVLATESATPKTSPAARDQPLATPIATPSAVATALCTMAPGTATRRTASNSSTWNWRPTPNIRRMTPTSANCSAMA